MFFTETCVPLLKTLKAECWSLTVIFATYLIPEQQSQFVSFRRFRS